MADYNQNERDDSTLLHLAIIEENKDVAKFLLKHNVPVDGRAINKQLALEFLTDAEHLAHLKSSLIGAGCAESSISANLDAMLSKSATALHIAARQESLGMTKLLLQHGADANAVMEGGETPLIVAVVYQRPSIVELLVQNKADIDAKTIWGRSAMHYAALTGQQKVLELLLKNGGDVDCADLEGMTPLHLSAEAGKKEIAAILLKHGADLKTRAKNGATALHFAAVMGHQEIVDLVMGYGADINVIMKHGALDLSPFSWITPEEETRTWEMVFKYTTKMSMVNWYSTIMKRIYKKSKTTMSPVVAEVSRQ